MTSDPKALMVVTQLLVMATQRKGHKYRKGHEVLRDKGFGALFTATADLRHSGRTIDQRAPQNIKQWQKQVVKQEEKKAEKESEEAAKAASKENGKIGEESKK
eukprot:473292-Pelagomonas_calceolata.AAC.3